MCVAAKEAGFLEKVVVVSSSMVYECSDSFPSKAFNANSIERPLN